MALSAFATYVVAGLSEIAGCYALWAWLKLGRSPLWAVAGIPLLILFGSLLTRIDAAAAGRAFAAYGGIYICLSLGWMWAVEGARPDRWDVSGALLCLLGAGFILLAPRAA